jgi:hypothetical protein
MKQKTRLWIYRKGKGVRVLESAKAPATEVICNQRLINDAGGEVVCRAIWKSSWWPKKLSVDEHRALSAWREGHPSYDINQPGIVNFLRLEAPDAGYGCCGCEIDVTPC